MALITQSFPILAFDPIKMTISGSLCKSNLKVYYKKPCNSFRLYFSEEEGTEVEKDDYSLAVGCIPYADDPRGQKYRGHLQQTESLKMCEPWKLIHQIV